MRTKEAIAVSAALNLAKNNKAKEALNCISGIDVHELSIHDLRKLALIYSYCGDCRESIRVWEMVVRKTDFGTGDFYMLSVSQIDCGYPEEAVVSLMQEIKFAEETGKDCYLDMSVISLAVLLERLGRVAEAVNILGKTDSSAAIYVQGIGLVKKQELLKKYRKTI